eukprot:CAMPEP_0196219336 /NCGR_PEP_ID=MMETSP0912-20130531/38623_1 /TAXON_ID=49265 /ORGANISM="Thalassiosira rotula, Strain GSO102" /LENGTH=49 /DNA_ID= /DNA_START= /DNA_END= /DNA_ORIENTATION=
MSAMLSSLECFPSYSENANRGMAVSSSAYEVIVGVDPIDAGGCSAEGLG